MTKNPTILVYFPPDSTSEDMFAWVLERIGYPVRHPWAFTVTRDGAFIAIINIMTDAQ